MSIRDELIQMVTEAVKMPISDVKKHLYQNFGLDSLSFIQLLIAIEDRFTITFEISEMQSCLDVSQLIEITEKKIKGKDKIDA